jgi:hypothetical protein
MITSPHNDPYLRLKSGSSSTTKKDDQLNCRTSSSDISVYHADFHEGHSTVGERQGSGRVAAGERHGTCESALTPPGSRTCVTLTTVFYSRPVCHNVTCVRYTDTHYFVYFVKSQSFALSTFMNEVTGDVLGCTRVELGILSTQENTYRKHAYTALTACNIKAWATAAFSKHTDVDGARLRILSLVKISKFKILNFDSYTVHYRICRN